MPNYNTIGRLIDPMGGRLWEPAEILARAQARVAALASLGLRRQDRVFLHNGNTLEFFVDLIATSRGKVNRLQIADLCGHLTTLPFTKLLCEHKTRNDP